uniref:Uncharacterized protein n=1 Tax=Sphaerodactylus townsendi TaxID=933632 RepID=A0ACB8FNA9_9SAUR
MLTRKPGGSPQERPLLPGGKAKVRLCERLRLEQARGRTEAERRRSPEELLSGVKENGLIVFQLKETAGEVRHNNTSQSDGGVGIEQAFPDPS